ncbi:IclR family transcriptional regulator [Microterricola gilva]|uniref:IclR family transcriptional regulator n=1 Tax=Microterricola gilva TaxID=393267 RepID=A0A4V2GAU7_9MICO|nr:IclR family transcriptional regulator [Microterricola gilva]
MVSRILAVLDRCLDSAQPLSLASLSLNSGLPKPTAWRIAESLVERGLLARTNDGYSAGAGLLDRGDRAMHQAALRAFVVPELVELQRQTAAAVWAVDVSRERDWVVIAQIYDRTAVQNHYSDQWQHDPTDPAILATSLGQVGLASRPEIIDGLLLRGVPRLTLHTEVEPKRVLASVQQARDELQLIEHGHVWLGWSCLTIPILDFTRQRTMAVLGIVDRTPRFVDNRFARAARRTADRLQLQWPLPQPPRQSPRGSGQ